MRISGIYFSWKRALGITKNKRTIADKMGIPMSKSGIERSICRNIFKILFVK